MKVGTHGQDLCRRGARPGSYPALPCCAQTSDRTTINSGSSSMENELVDVRNLSAVSNTANPAVKGSRACSLIPHTAFLIRIVWQSSATMH